MPGHLGLWGRIAMIAGLILTFGAAIYAVALHIPGPLQSTVRYGVAFAMVQTCIVALLVCGLVVYKQFSARRDSRKQDIVFAIEQALAKSEEDATAVADRWPSEFMEVAQHALTVISGTAVDRVLHALCDSTCHELMMKNIRHTNPMLAAQAVRLLASTRTPEALETLSRAREHTSHVVRAVATKEIIANGTTEAKTAILNGLPDAELHERLSVYSSIDIESDEAISFIGGAVKSEDPARVRVALEMVHALGRMLPLGVPGSLSRSTDMEIRIKFYKALPLLTLIDEDVVSVLKRGLCDEHWQVRAMAAKACGHYRAASLADDLARLCFAAAVPAEAGHAAAALARLGGEARSRLQSSAVAGSAWGHQAAAEVLQQSRVRPEASVV